MDIAIDPEVLQSCMYLFLGGYIAFDNCFLINFNKHVSLVKSIYLGNFARARKF